MKIPAGCLIGLLLCPLAAHAASLSFTEARALLHERSDALRASEAHVESRREEMESLKMLGGPTAGVQAAEIGGQTRVKLSKSVPTPLGDMPVSINERYGFNGPRAAVTATWPLFTGGRISAQQEASRYAVDEASAQNRAVGVRLDAELIERYFGLQLALSVARLQRRMLEEQDRELARAVRFEQEGMISSVERMGVQVARDAAERASLKAQDDARVACLRLECLLRDADIGELATPLFVLGRPLEPMEEWVARAEARNPAIAEIEAKVRQADQGVAISKSAWSPQVGAFGQYSFIRHYQTPVEPVWLAGIGMNFTVWDAKDRLASFRSAKADLREAKAAQAETLNQVRTDAQVAWLATRNADRQYRLSASNVALARENLALKQKGFGEGLATALDMTEARNQLLAAEVERRRAAYEFVVNYALLHAIAGSMEEFAAVCENSAVPVEYEQ